MIQPPSAAFAAAEAALDNSPVYIFTIGGYEVPREDVLEAGQCTISRSLTLGDPVAAQHSCTLDNSTGKYSPHKSACLFPDRTWYYQLLTIEMGYELYPGAPIASGDRLLLYRGYITGWDLDRDKNPDPEESMPENKVTITSAGLISALFRRQVGQPDDNGDPRPLNYGSIIKPGIELLDKYPWAPDKFAGAETGDLSEIVVWNGGTGGTIAASQDHAYPGGLWRNYPPSQWSFKINCPNVTDTAIAHLPLAPGNNLTGMLTAAFFFTQYSLPAGYGFPQFMWALDNTMIAQVYVGIDAAGEFFVHSGTEVGRLGINIADIIEKWITISLGIVAETPGLISVYVNNQKAVEVSRSYPFGFSHMGAGLGSIPDGGPWEVYIDNMMLLNNWPAAGYYLPGAPFASIDAAYRDAVIIPKEMPYYWKYRESRYWYLNPFVRRISATEVVTNLWDSNPAYGALSFNDYSDLPSGSVLIGATANAIKHPVDVILALVDEGNQTDYLDADSFTSAKETNSGDEIRSSFTEISAADAIAEVCHKTLYDFFEDFGVLRLLPYKAIPGVPVADMSIGDNELVSKDSFDLSGRASKIRSKYGWYSADPSLYKLATDAATLAEIGPVVQEINFEYSENVSSDLVDMISDRVNKLLTRLSHPVETIKAVCPLNSPFARLQIGDEIPVQQEDFFDESRPFAVNSKVLDMDANTIEFSLGRFLGELAS